MFGKNSIVVKACVNYAGEKIWSSKLTVRPKAWRNGKRFGLSICQERCLMLFKVSNNFVGFPDPPWSIIRKKLFLKKTIVMFGGRTDKTYLYVFFRSQLRFRQRRHRWNPLTILHRMHELLSSFPETDEIFRKYENSSKVRFWGFGSQKFHFWKIFTGTHYFAPQMTSIKSPRSEETFYQMST